MSTVYPKRRIRNTHVVDPVSFNENILVFTEAAGGQLGEQNWKEDAFSSSTADRDLFSANIGFTVRKAIEEVDYSSINTGGTKTDAAQSAASLGGFEIPKTGSWSTVTGCTLDFDTVGSVAFIFARALYWTSDDEVVVGGVGNHPADPGIMLALRVDGNLIPETITGSGELANDLVNSTNSPGICVSSYDAHPIVTRTLEPLPPGRHTIELVARLAGPQTDAVDTHFLLGRELCVLEIGAG